jgi:lipoate-protein ligase A
MAYEFRVLETGFHRAAFNMGLDEALLRSVAEGRSLPTLRFYGWAPPAVSIGYFQGLHEEVDTAACKAAGIDVVRRITGGGAVFHHHEVTYSIVLPLGHPLARANILDSYRLLLGGIIEGLAAMDIHAEFAPINDIVAGGKKISGNAQTRKLGCILQHGTVILDVDVDQMFTVLRVSQEKAKGRLIEDIKSRVTSVKQCLPQSAPMSFEILYATTIQSLREGFAKALHLVFVNSGPTESELQLAGQLGKEKFSSQTWLASR